MDPINIIQFSLYSKIMSESINILDSGYISKNILMFIFIMMMTYKMIPNHLYDYIEKQLETFLKEKTDECEIIIPYHTKTYSCSIGIKSITKTLYSDRFLALNHYLKNATDITSYIEIMNFENTRYDYDSKSEYILLPNNTQKIKICNKNDIYFEIVVEKSTEDETKDDKSKQTKTNRIKTKNYIYKISKKGKQNMNILNDFMKSCVDKYTTDTSDKNQQMIYEYMKASTDEDDKACMTFECSPFKSNKTFDNLFFEGKQEIREDIQQFVMNMDKEKKEIIEAEYKRKGIPFKRIYLLYGPPGTGKSSLIKAMINETGRHCILVQWSKIRTSAEFANLFHRIKINSKNLSQNEIIIVFEDFDANDTSAIKIRDSLKKQLTVLDSKTETETETETNTEEKTTDTENVVKKTLEAMFLAQPKTCDDVLTLECVLNTLDGIKELYDAVVVFTTNDLSSIDPAVIRPGRVDKLIKMDLVKPNIVKEIVKHYYNVNNVYIDELDRLTTDLSPALIQSICNKHNNICDCINELLTCYNKIEM
jgi:SpoVK/Ycf46/Vps4 family AAA+-type ATPase